MPVKCHCLSVDIVARHDKFRCIICERAIVSVLEDGTFEAVSHVNDSIGVEIHAVAVDNKLAFSCCTVLDFTCIRNEMTVFRTQNENVRNFVI